MVTEHTAVPMSLYDASLQPRTIRMAVRDRPAETQGVALSREEQAELALDVFDRTVQRTEHLLAHLRYNGYDITTVADNLSQLRDLRGDLTKAFSNPGQEIRRHLQNVFEIRVGGLCSAISSLKNDDPSYPDERYRECLTEKDTAFSRLTAGDRLSGTCDGA